MKNSTKIAFTAALIGTLGFGGLTRVYAQQPQSAIAIMPQNRSNISVAQSSDGDGEVNDAIEAPENAKSSHSLAANDDRGNTQLAQTNRRERETNDGAEEQQEADQLQSLAKITAQQAQQAAEKAVRGKASSVKLENEDGNLVYAVEIGQQEVIVDAGNGRVLYIENEDQEDEKNEASRPKSSIQVPQTNDRETNDDGK